MPNETHYEWKDKNLILRVYVQPKASKNEFCAVHGDGIKIRITAPPVDGKANQQLIQFLAKTFHVTKSQVELLSGKNSRQKRFCIYSPKKLPAFVSAEICP